MRIYGLTGGTGSGKSEVAKHFAKRGIPVIDADKVGHSLLEPGGAAVDAVIEAFGHGILTNGRIDRAKLGDIVFAEREARRRLNAVVHPLLTRAIAEQCAALARQGRKVAIIDAALLAEGGKRDAWLDGLIVVTCSPEIRRRRLVEACDITPERAQQRIAAQTPPETKVPLADWVIENEGALEELRACVDQVADEIIGLTKR